MELEKQVKDDLRVIRNCCHKTRKGTALIATYRSSRYPYFYPRDAAAVSRALRMCIENNCYEESSTRILEGVSEFLLACQSKKGHWGQKYEMNAKDGSLYKQEDNTAHGIIFLCNYLAVQNAGSKGKEKRFFKMALKAWKVALKDYFNKEVGLFYSTTSIHEFSIETGYTLWTNCAYLEAGRLLQDAAKKIKSPEKNEIKDFCDSLWKTIKKKLFFENRFCARLTLEHRLDLRADITLMAPLYFGIEKPDAMRKTIGFVRKKLWNKKLGLLNRYESDLGDMVLHNHAGLGPWIQYSGILAQCYYLMDRVGEGDKVIRSIEEYRSELGFLPEHVSLKNDFDEFWGKEWLTGIDFRKEFDEKILLPEITFDRILDEVNLMARSYRRIRLGSRKHRRHYTRFGVPLAWSHAEFVAAKILREKRKK